MKRAGGLPTEGNESHDLGSQKEMKVMKIVTVQSQSAGELWAAILNSTLCKKESPLHSPAGLTSSAGMQLNGKVTRSCIGCARQDTPVDALTIAALIACVRSTNAAVRIPMFPQDIMGYRNSGKHLIQERDVRTLRQPHDNVNCQFPYSTIQAFAAAAHAC